MGLLRRYSAVLLLLGVLGWLLCNEWRAGRSSAVGEGPILTAETVSLTFDAFLYSQQLRRKLLRSFCAQRAEVSGFRQLVRFLRLRANARHRLVYCGSPGTGTTDWERALEILNDVPAEAGMLVNESAPSALPDGDLSWKDVDTIDRLPPSYTKVIFVRHPFQRLISAYSHRRFAGEPLEMFVQRALGEGTAAEESAGWRPLVQMCQPCFVRYDYVVAHGLLEQELGHLLRRLGFPEQAGLPPFRDSEESLWSQRLMDQHLGHLPAWLLNHLLRFYRGDFAAFNFTHGLTLN
ncbi:carbohydrate sulfotransferase 8-like [Pristis pectinata]|uniref:carbohydrate sulfotransferase 8-like n=1 Tax=Pristis pectinata TaxID=685728 RepID=UPI00223D2EA8|nr:carbohydrate sulfotransferase 8-like [Pristis pectinata]